MTTTFNITPELWQEMRAFSTDSRPRFLYVITHHNPDGSLNMGYSGRKTADTLSEAKTYPGSSSDSLFFEDRILSHRSEYQFIIVGYCRSTEELGNSEDALNHYMKRFYKKQWANKKLNGKWTVEGLIPIIKKGKKIKYVRPEELEHYKSLGWSKGKMFYKMRKEGEALQEVGEEQVRSLLEAGYFFEGHEKIMLHHPEVKGSTIQVSKETGFMEGDILRALKENFILGKAPAGHETTADEKTVEKVKDYIEFVKKIGRQRMADAKRANTVYTLKKGDEPPLGFTRYDVLGKLKEDYRFTQKSIDICNKKGKYKPHCFERKGENLDRELQHQKLIRLLESGLWQIGSVWEEPMEGLLQLEGLSPSILNGWAKGSYKVLIDKEGKEHEVFNTEVLGKLKEDYRFTIGSVQICNKGGTVKRHRFEINGKNLDREIQHKKLICLLESGLWQVGSVWEEPAGGLLQLEGLSPSILNGWARDSYKVLIDKEGKEHVVFNTEVLGKLKEDYRFTQKEISICNKAGTVKPHVFENTTIKATREERHLKLIRLLESGDWQVGSVWEEPVVTKVVEEPVEANPVEEKPVVAVVIGEPEVQSAWGEMVNFFDSCKDLPRTRKTRYTI
jgi:hypothetical protein